MILEGIVTTLNDDGTPNVSPMGPEVDGAFDELVLKPYRTSTTYRNLKRTSEGVFHVTDDVEMLARAAVRALDPLPETLDCSAVRGKIIAGACRWYAFRVRALDDSRERTRIECAVVDRGRLRDFCGFNRAKHAVLEAAILATRTGFLPPDEIMAQFKQLATLVEKTGGPAEARTFAFLEAFVQRQFAARAPR